MSTTVHEIEDTSAEVASTPTLELVQDTPHECVMEWRMTGRVPGVRGSRWALYVCAGCGERERVSL